MDLENKVVVISGATGGLGRFVTQQLADQRAKLVLLGRDSIKLDELIDTVGLSTSRHITIPVDLTDPKETKKAVNRIIHKFGRIDILLHLVGGWTGGIPVVDVDKADIWNMIQQHLWSTFHIAQAVVPKMEENQWGRIIAISSPFALSPRPNGAPYAIGKAAQEALLLTLAQELKGSGVTSNILLVKTIDLENERDQSPTLKNASWTSPEEILEAIMFLVSDKARMVNGARLPLYGSP